MRRPLKIQSFSKIKQLNITIETVIDIGILTGTGELMFAFGDKKHFLVEPIVEWNETINNSYSQKNIDYILVNVAAANTNGTMNMQTSSVVPGKPISHARLSDKTEGDNIRVRRQSIWNRLMLNLSESLAHLLVYIKRLDCYIASAVV